jgi:hypothetical protein
VVEKGEGRVAEPGTEVGGAGGNAGFGAPDRTSDMEGRDCLWGGLSAWSSDVRLDSTGETMLAMLGADEGCGYEDEYDE